MQLTKIKLAGFKSFVDPTTIPFPSSLNGIVGPNGCGKSNVIDAVRWVMGESSARHLRGDTMADVIFNGSQSRKPVGHGTIELVFDNSDGKAGGQYAGYSELAIKRVVGRDGQSSYYLNGSRCRRRDITDIFLGTGLGPRSYAVIEQGMISRFIEARPEEMRNFLEEAAGISRYKERRRETTNRIRHTRDNIDRLNDIRDELEKQLQRLDRQAKVAEKYRHLKKDERQLKAQLLALKWRGIEQHAAAQQDRIADTETAYEGQVAGQRNIEADIEKKREQHNEATETFNKVQADYYAVASEISRVEQSIEHGREKCQQLREDLQQVEANVSDYRENLQRDRERTAELSSALKKDEPALEQLQQVEAGSSDALAMAEDSMQDWQIDWDEFNDEAAGPAREVEVERARIQQLEHQLTLLKDRIARLEKEDGGRATGHEDEISKLLVQSDAAARDAGALQDELQECGRRINEQRDLNHQLGENLDEARGALQTLRGRQASLEALQEAALGKREEAVIEWLDKHGLKSAHRLAENLKVDSGWERAVETVLGFHLESVCVDSLDKLAGSIGSLRQGAIGILEKAAGSAKTGTLGTPLSDYVDSSWQMGSLLSGVYAVPDLKKAMALRGKLAGHESLITPDGIWLGNHWMRVARDTDEKAGILHRENEMKGISEALARLEHQVESQQGKQDEGKQQLQILEQERDAKQTALNEAGKQQADIKARLSATEASLEQIMNHRERIQSDVGEMRTQLENGNAELSESRQRLESAAKAVKRHQKRRDDLTQRRDNLRESLDGAKEQARIDHDAAHQLALKVESTRTAFTSTRQAMERIEKQLTQLEARHHELQQLIKDTDRPADDLTAEREELLGRRLEIENLLGNARKQMEDIGQQMDIATQKRNEAEQKAEDIRTALEQLRMDFKGISVRQQTIQEQIDETDFQREALLEGLSEEDTGEQWQLQVEKMDRRITRLGPINLAAIDEFSEMSERKEYLDAQLNDLLDALKTLETAMHKIDKETRARFKETFDKVNTKLKETFPKLFGGGEAYLEMETADLLESGVTLMARPPGKRLSNIHLMSGGEKALTAVAMIFSIFALNPAPFCILDEVDAPLDDANVARFCEMVREMSDKVQFIFITHNKITMELASHIMGVTMHEPGVSRIVAVDMEEAAAMAAM
ncbi:MAG: chromosome segregation protein SMC [Gammaproteobacteria bacterium]|nr:MAG: chromosome segregation protein SMC [Gammaproteobacteria bacterium]